MRALNRTRKQILMTDGSVAESVWTRLCGLLGHSALVAGKGLALPRSKGIHTFGMRFAIDIVFLDERGRVIRLIHALKPFRVSPLVWNSAMVLELPAGILLQTGTQVGDQIEIVR